MTLIRYSNEELEQFRELLESRLKETTREYNALLWQLTRDSVNKESDPVRNDTLYIKAARVKRNLDNLRSALLRVENKTYGICIVSGTLIPKERLLAVPHTSVNTEVSLYPLRAGA